MNGILAQAYIKISATRLHYSVQLAQGYNNKLKQYVAPFFRSLLYEPHIGLGMVHRK